MRCALYLRPAGLAQWPHFDDQVKAWLRGQGYEPVDGGGYEAVVCLPYDKGGCYYHRDVSVAMAQRIVEHISVDGEIRWINLEWTETDADDSLTEVRLRFEEHGYARKPTLAILSEGEAAELDQDIRARGEFAHQDLGVRWRPPPPPEPPVQRQPRAPGAPL
ncbi:hypothetical protein [Methylobacterium sp. A52T]